MNEDNDKTAYIRAERQEKSYKYIAKVFDEPPREINKTQYNAIVKLLRGVNWGQNIEDEQSVINQIIESQLKPAD
jgi:hypothetical protein